MKWQTMSNFSPMMEWENCANTCKHKLPMKARKVFATLLLSLALFTFLIGYKYGYFKWKKSFITWRAVCFNGTWMSSVPLFTQQAHSHSRWGSWMIWGRGEGGEEGDTWIRGELHCLAWISEFQISLILRSLFDICIPKSLCMAKGSGEHSRVHSF